MQILIVGLGDIARKAYLPVLATRPELELQLCTRDLAVLAAVGDQYRIAHRFANIEEALAAARFDAAFVHAATHAHPALVEALLTAGVPVLVDKPLAYSLAEATQLVELAVAKGLLLAVGFNRRFAPDHRAVREGPRSVVLMQKHRRAQAAPPREAIFDDFVHVADTLRWMAPGETTRTSIETMVRNGLLEAVTLTLAGADGHAIGIMHRASGMDEERLDVFGADAKRSVLNLSDRVDHDGAVQLRRRGDWTSVAVQRGFDVMCEDFLARVRAGRATDAADLLATHRLCEQIVEHAGG